MVVKCWEKEWIEFLQWLDFSLNLPLNHDYVKEWNPYFIDFLTDEAIIQQTEYAKTIICDECEDHCEVEPYHLQDKEDNNRWFITCGKCGTTEIDKAVLKQWTLDLFKVSVKLNKTLRLKNKPEIKTDNQFFFLGYYGDQNNTCRCYLIVSGKFLNHCSQIPKGSLVFLPLEKNIKCSDGDMLFLPLEQAIVFLKNKMVADTALINGLLNNKIHSTNTNQVIDNYERYMELIPELKIRHYKNKTTVTYREDTHNFNEKQALVFFRICDSKINGSIYVSTNELLDLVSNQFGTVPDSLSDIFKYHKTWRKIIVQEKNKKGYYRLNLY